MACGGLKSAERKIDTNLLNRHHSVRVTDFAMECQNYLKNVFLKSGKSLDVRIGIHSGPIISGVVGETKPQFSLFGDSVDKAIKICQATDPGKVSVSKETLHYLELYTNNLNFTPKHVTMKGYGKLMIYTVAIFRGRNKLQWENGKQTKYNEQGKISEHGSESEDKEEDNEGKSMPNKKGNDPQ